MSFNLISSFFRQRAAKKAVAIYAAQLRGMADVIETPAMVAVINRFMAVVNANRPAIEKVVAELKEAAAECGPALEAIGQAGMANSARMDEAFSKLAEDVKNDADARSRRESDDLE